VALAWALSQIGSADAQGSGQASLAGASIAAAAGFGLAGLAAYAWWERTSPYPMTPPRLARNRPFLGLNLATLMIYGSVSIMFFLLPFELVDHRGLSATAAGLAFLPFTLGVGLLSRSFGGFADSMGARAPLIAGPAAAGIAYLWMALARDAPLALGVIGPMLLLGFAFAAIAAPLTASVLSSVGEVDEGLASGVNNAVSKVAQLGGVAMAAGIATLVSGYRIGLTAAALVSAAGAVAVALTLPPPTTGARRPVAPQRDNR
jgi:predicted MFS family arabinose efflux permease